MDATSEGFDGQTREPGAGAMGSSRAISAVWSMVVFAALIFIPVSASSHPLDGLTGAEINVSEKYCETQTSRATGRCTR